MCEKIKLFKNYFSYLLEKDVLLTFNISKGAQQTLLNQVFT